MTVHQDEAVAAVAVASAPAASNNTPLILEFDMDQMVIGDLALIDRFRTETAKKKAGKKAEFPMGELVEFLDRVVVGGASQIKFSRFAEVMTRFGEALNSYMGGTTEPESEKN